MSKKFLLVNFITLIRVIGAILLYPIYLHYGFFGLAIAVLLFISTDSIDGFLARTLHASTFFGAAFDALSDKLFNIIVLLILAFSQPLIIIVLVFELLILLIGFYSTIKGNKSKVSIFGKIKMVVLSLGVVAILLFIDYPKVMEIFNLNMIDYNNIVKIIAYVIITFEAVAFINYLRIFLINSKENTVKDTLLDKKLINKKQWKIVLFSPEYYEKNKNQSVANILLEKKNK